MNGNADSPHRCRPLAGLCIAAILALCACAAVPGRQDSLEQGGGGRYRQYVELLGLLEKRKKGEWAEADRGFRSFLLKDGREYERTVALAVGYWKGYSVGSPDFVKKYSDGSAEASDYRAFGEHLLSRGLSSLAAIELERANVLGDGSEELYGLLLESYGLAGDSESFDRTSAVAKALHPGSARIGRAASRLPAETAASSATVTYPQWIAWDAPLGEGFHFERPLWRGGRLVYAIDSDGEEARIWSWEPETARLVWSFDVNYDLPPQKEKGRPGGKWHERIVQELSANGADIDVGYYVQETTESGGQAVSSGLIRLDSRTGAPMSHETRPGYESTPDQAGCEVAPRTLPAPCKRTLVDGDFYFLLGDMRVLRLARDSAKTVWEAKLDDASGEPLAQRGGLLLVPGSRVVTALDKETGKALWKYPIEPDHGVDASSATIVVSDRQRQRLLGLRPPAGLDSNRRALVAAAESLKDDALAQRLLLNVLDLDPSNEAAYSALARLARSPLRPPDVEAALRRYPNFLDPESKAFAEVREALQAGTPVRWTRKTPQQPAGLAFGESRLYILDGRALAAVDRADGKTVWELPLGDDVSGSPAQRQRLALSRGVLFFSYVEATLLAVSAESGRRMWRRDLAVPGSVWSGVMNPLAEGGTVYASVIYGAEKEGRSGYFFRLHALRAKDGKELWSTDVVPSVENCDYKSSHMRPAARGGTVYFPTPAGDLYAVDAKTGKVAWSFAADKPPEGEAQDDAVSAPVFDADAAYVLGPVGLLYALDAATGKVRWKERVRAAEPNSETVNSMAKRGDNLCFSTWEEESVRCYDPRARKLAWSHVRENYSPYPPALFRGSLWIGGDRKIFSYGPDGGDQKDPISVPSFGVIYWLEADSRFLYAVHEDGISQLAP